MGTLNVLKCASAVGSRKVVYAASGTLYGEPTSIPVSEPSADGAHPESPYGISKKVAIEYLAFYARQRGLDFTALALGNVYGPRQDPSGEAGVIAIFASSMLAGDRATDHLRRRRADTGLRLRRGHGEGVRRRDRSCLARDREHRDGCGRRRSTLSTRCWRRSSERGPSPRTDRSPRGSCVGSRSTTRSRPRSSDGAREPISPQGSRGRSNISESVITPLRVERPDPQRSLGPSSRCR